jgi:hypothetical protein
MRKLLLLVALMGASSTAWAQFGELWFSAGQSLISNGGLGTTAQLGGSKDDLSLKNGFRFALRIGFNSATRYGQEVMYGYSRTKLHYSAFATGGSPVDQGMAIHTGAYNFLVYGTQEGTKIRPFVTGGVGFNNYVPPGSSAASGGGSSKFGLNYGGGVKVRVGNNYGVRFDLRQYTNTKPFGLALREGWIRQTEVSAGFGYVF